MLQLVLGSTGSLGSAIVNELTSSGKPVRALVRSPTKARKVFASPDKVELIQGSLEDIRTLDKAFDGVDLFLFDPHVSIDSSDDDLKRLADKVRAKKLVIGSVVARISASTSVRTLS